MPRTRGSLVYVLGLSTAKIHLPCFLLGFVAALLSGCGGGGPSGPPPATHISVTVGAAVTVGMPFNVTVTALDASGNVASSYTGVAHFASSDPQAALPPDSSLTNGTKTFSATLKTAGNQTVTVSSGSLTAGTTGVTVSTGVAAQFSVTTAAPSATAGTAFNLTLTALDAGNNPVASYTGVVHFTSSDPQATLPADAALANGTGTFSVTLKTAGNVSVTATDTATTSITGTLNGITVNPGPASQLTVTPPGPAATTGIAFDVTVNVVDAFNNVATSYSGTVKITSSDAQATIPANSALPGGTGVFAVTLKTLGPQTITATDTVTASLKGTSPSIKVVTNAATHISFTNAPGSSLTRQTMSLTVNALDAANNQAMAYAGTVHFTSTDSQAKLPANTAFAAGTATVSATLETVGNQTITGTDKASSSINGSASITVTAAPDLGITNAAPPSGTTGQVYYPRVFKHCPPANPFCQTFIRTNGFQLTAQGGIGPYTWSWAPASGSSLPPGLNVGNPLGTPACLFNFIVVIHRPCIYGTPTQPGTYNVVVTVTDGGLPTVQSSANYTITIANPPPPVVNTTPPPPPGVENQTYSYTFTASGYGPFTWSESGALATGLAFDNNTATLSGTPTQTGSFTFTVTATDQFKQPSTATNNFTLVVTVHGFTATGSMGTARRFHTATLLNTGKVLIAGGEDAASNAFASAELYDPSSGTFTPTAGSMTIARAGHTATLLSNGKVLIAGGTSGGDTEAALSTAELYDPATDTFTATTGSMTAARVVHTATLLSDGTVLVAGGDVIFFNGIPNSNIKSLSSAEIYNANTGKFTATTGNLTVRRESHTANLLSSGKVLIAGGSSGTLGNDPPAVTLYATAELYDPSTGHFTATTGMLTQARDLQTANLLSTGKVLIAGGESNSGGTSVTAELFDSSSQSFTATGIMTTPRYYHDATTLSDGTVLLTGGSDDAPTRAKSAAEVYDPTGGTFANTGSMIYPRVWHTSTLLPNGKVLITGGAGNDSNPVATCELYQ